MVKLELFHMAEDFEPYFYGAIISQEFIFGYGFYEVGHLRKGKLLREPVFYFFLKPKTGAELEKTRTALSQEGFKQHDGEMELDKESEQGLVRILKERGEVSVQNGEDNFPEYPLFGVVREKIKKSLSEGHVWWIY